MKWFRFYHETLDDPKVQLLSDRRFRQWVNLLCIANQSPERGVLPGIEAVAFRLRETLDETLQMFADFEAVGLVDRCDEGRYRPHNWDRRQFKSDDVTERVEKHRKATYKKGSAKTNVSTPLDETLQETFSDNRVQSTDTEPEKEIAARTAPAETPAALVDAYCQARGQPFPDDAGPFVNIAKSLRKRNYTSADVEDCTRYLLSDPYWQPILTFKILASQIPDWVQNGRPDKAPEKSRNGRAREPDFSGIEAFDETMTALEQRK